MYRKIRDNVPVENTHGITGYSPLLDLNMDFNIVDDVPIDEFHIIKEGLVKQALTRLFLKNAVSQDVLKAFNSKYMKMRTFKDFTRRTRTLQQMPDFKGSYLLINNQAFT